MSYRWITCIDFARKSNAITNEHKALLSSVAQKMRDNPDCVVAVAVTAVYKNVQQLSWERVNAIIITWLKMKASATALFFKYSQKAGDPNMVELRNATGWGRPTHGATSFPFSNNR